MDIILTRKDGYFDRNFLYRLITELENINFLSDHLTLPRIEK